MHVTGTIDWDASGRLLPTIKLKSKSYDGRCVGNGKTKTRRNIGQLTQRFLGSSMRPDRIEFTCELGCMEELIVPFFYLQNENIFWDQLNCLLKSKIQSVNGLKAAMRQTFFNDRAPFSPETFEEKLVSFWFLGSIMRSDYTAMKD